MAEPMAELSPQKLNAPAPTYAEPDMDTTSWHDPPSSPFIAHVDDEDQENIAPNALATPKKLLPSFEDDFTRSAFKASPEKKFGLQERTSPVKMPSRKQSLAEFEEDSLESPPPRASPKKASPVKQMAAERSEPTMGSRSRRSSPTKASRNPSVDSVRRAPVGYPEDEIDDAPTVTLKTSELRENEGLTVAMRNMDQAQASYEPTSTHRSHDEIVGDATFDDTEFNPDGPDLTSLDMDDTGFSMFSEMPGIDMTKFAALRQSPTKNGLFDPATPRARAQMTPSTVQTVRRSERTPSPTPRRSRRENDTTNLLLDFTAQLEGLSGPTRGPPKSTTEPNLASYYQNQRSPGKGSSSRVPSTPSQSRQLMDLLDFELPPPPTPRSMPTVTIRELESLKSNFQSQISSLTASLSGKEAQVESLVKAISDAEHRVGQAQESVRDERSAREYAEAQMEDWKKKGEEVQNLLQEVQGEVGRIDAEREQLLTRLAEAEKRAEEAETRSSELETKVIEAESKNVDMTTFLDPDENEKKIYSEMECQTAIAEKVNEVARDLHTAYKAKHEKKIKALKDNYQKKADERCKELRVQIIRLERRVEEAEKKRDDTFSKVLPTQLDADKDSSSPASTSRPEDLKLLEDQKSEIEHLKAKLAGLQSELESLRKSHDHILQDLEAERIEKGELVAAAEQMLAMCGEKMEELQQEDFRKSVQMAAAPPAPAPAPQAETANAPSMRSTGFLAGGAAPRPGSALGGAAGRPGSAMGHQRGNSNSSAAAKPSGLRAPGGFGFSGGSSALNRSTSGGSGKSRILSNIERMGGSTRGAGAE
ncbi:uncharacterized protein CC84DRAFT_1161946 [Paraphaeosphaeria sporulosa]|uniref:Uncharacterized protein n=1 Tax=Paraphaeosphaeria sporulosa TaxID=1460663 RepID=A0A177CL00_9PLEO|nr:uncharacterized protein CC84DRAFT_1161946 [Paraphaeosphaeria sporulosa]OAG07901.1 hypothetical protein CC84DRAFT_1161946 [Paraphaeosphaeria sporulosa]